jgi:tetratricopeptide (TPR) repeat protein
MKTIRRRWTLLWVAGLLAATIFGTDTFAGPKKDATQEWEARGKAYAHMMRSAVAARHGELKRAADEIQLALKLQPDSAAIHAQAAEMLYRLGRSEQAESAARRAQEIEPDHPRALRFLAERATDRARRATVDDVDTHEEALRLLLRLKDLGHADAGILHAIRAIRVRLGDDSGALEAARELVEMRPGDKQAVSQLIGLLLEQGRDADALDAVLIYVSKHPNDTELLGFAQELTDRLGAWKHVVAVLSAEPGLERSNTVAQGLWATALLELGDVPGSVAAFERALIAQPEDRDLRRDAAHAFRIVGRLADAASLLHDLGVEAPSDREILLMLGETLADQGILDGAQNAFVSVLRLFSTKGSKDSAPIRDAIRRRMILLYLSNDELLPAWDLHAELEQLDDPQTFELGARLAIASEDWARARSEIKQLRDGSEPGVAALLDGELLLRSGKPAKAELRFQEAIDTLGPLIQAQIAETYMEVERAEQGEALLRSWVESDADNPDAHYYLGSYLFRVAGLEQAEPALRRVIELDDSHAAALNFLGYSLADDGVKLEEALELIQHALEFDPWNGAYLDSLGWVYFRMGRFEEAREPLEAAAREFPADAVVLEHLGDLYERRGENDLAISAWGQALNNDPEDRAKIEAKIALLAAPTGVDRR